MTAALFDRLDDEDRQRLRAAGWTEIDYFGKTSWKSPDGRMVCSREEALKRLDCEPGKE